MYLDKVNKGNKFYFYCLSFLKFTFCQHFLEVWIILTSLFPSFLQFNPLKTRPLRVTIAFYCVFDLL